MVYARGIMKRGSDATTVVGYAVGVGLVFVATVGVYWNFWQPALAEWVWVAGSFGAGALAGGLFALIRGSKL